MSKSLSVSSDPRSLDIICETRSWEQVDKKQGRFFNFQNLNVEGLFARGGRGLHTWEYWGCAAGQGAFFELPALACVIISMG